MKYKAAIFDLDGTILDTLEDLADSVNYSLKSFGLPERTLDDVRSTVGHGIHDLVERSVPEDIDRNTVDKVFACFREHYGMHCADKTRPYTGVCDVIRAVREQGIKTAVVSNKADFAVKSLCEQYFPGLFDLSIGDRKGQRKKPWPDSVIAVLDHFGCGREEAVYIGDSEVDIETARNAGTDLIMVGWGFRDEDCLRDAGAGKILQTMQQLEREILDT